MCLYVVLHFRLDKEKTEKQPCWFRLKNKCYNWLMFGRIQEKITVFKARFKKKIFRFKLSFKAYIKRILHPTYLFPVKIITYSLYYLVLLVIKIVIRILKIIWYLVSWPFRGWKNFGKTILWTVLTAYLLAMTFVILVVLADQYGSFEKFFCFGDINAGKVKPKVVRILGTYGQGSGFFISPNEVLTNFHVIEGETSPKIVFQDGTIDYPQKMVGDKQVDLAVITVNGSYPDFVLPMETDNFLLTQNESLYSIGYPEGTDIKGSATIMSERLTNDVRYISGFPSLYIPLNLTVVPGMSGGPLLESCGKVVGINQLGIAGLSLFISSASIGNDLPKMTDKDITRVELHPERSPEDAVFAYYTYIGARNMEEGFKLLSTKYLEKTNFDEWTARFKNIVNIMVVKTEKVAAEKDTVFVKFSTDNWVNNDLETHYYEGTWQTVKEDTIYKMNKSHILEVDNPDWSWFYE